MRTGAAYVASLEDERNVILDGERVACVASHPAFEGIVKTVSGLYDDPPADSVFMIPRSREDLERRRTAIAHWARKTNGFVGRGPDHVAGFLAGFASAPDVFRERGENVTRFYGRVSNEDLYVAYVIIPPQVDRSGQSGTVQVGVAGERDGGIVVRGAQMLGTAAAIANWMFVSCIVPLKPGDEDYALSFVLPVATPGLKLYCRRPYAVDQPSRFDYPLSTRFDESDALVVFDDVFVPWEQVFVYRDVELTRAQFFETPAHVLGNNQAQIRLVVKLQFLAGLARKIAATTKIEVFPQVQEKLGELASLAAMVEGMELASEAACLVDKRGVARPNPRFLYGAMGLQSELYPRALAILRELCGGGVIELPDTVLGLEEPDFQRYVGADKIKLFKLAWDAFGPEFGGRHHQYEMFYAGAPHVARGYSFRNYRYDEAVELVEQFLGSYGAEA